MLLVLASNVYMFTHNKNKVWKFLGGDTVPKDEPPLVLLIVNMPVIK